ncbi:hypothetical protein DH09_17370 [Bacillaceae bacterium JMAK1]|nr:hypothetical protein DH09_17370 [Bacillaceae bacterium JMAK1]
MLLTYIAIVVLLLIMLKAIVELTQILIYGTVPQKKILEKSFKRLEGRKKSVYSTQSAEERQASKRRMNILQAAVICLILFLLGMMLFRSVFFALLIALLGLFYPKVKANHDHQKQEKIMLLQFRDAILSLASSLKAGTSLQVALRRCETDMTRELQLQKDKPMLDALERINGDIQLGTPVEDALQTFRNEHDIEDIAQFVDAIIMTRTKGGNLADVIDNTAESISDKIMIQQEIKVATAQKKMEASLLTFMPVGIVVVLMMLNPDYMQPMYDQTLGTFMLFAAVLMLVANYFIGRKVTNIDV